MKRFLGIAMCLGFTFCALAQKGHVVAVYRPVYIYNPSFGIGYYSPFYGYGMPYGAYSYGARPPASKLERQEAEIKSDYTDRIYSVRQDNTLTKDQKRASVKALKKQRKQELKDLVANYHKQPKYENSTQ